MSDSKSEKNEAPQPARDTTFDGVVPEKVWITFDNKIHKDRLTVTLEVNGIEKVLTEFYIPGLDPNEGHTLNSHNLTWLVRRPTANPDWLKEAFIRAAGLIEDSYMRGAQAKVTDVEWITDALARLDKESKP